MASNNEGYWSRSWALLTRDEGWIKPLLVLSAAQLVPIVGMFGVDGYALEWGRLTAWGVDSSPKQKGVDVGACIKSGARAFVVAIGYGLVLALIRSLVSTVFGDTLGSLLAAVITIFGAVLITVAKLRATIYQKIGAGYQVDRIIDMIKRDHKGLLKITGLMAILSLVVGIIASLLLMGVMLTQFGAILDLAMTIENNVYVDDWYIVSTVFGIIGSALPLLFVVGYLLSIASTFSSLILTTAVGLWMRQFDVQNWGESSDPLPSTAAQATPWDAGQEPVDPQQYVPDQPLDPQQYVPEQYEPQPQATAETYVQPVVPASPTPASNVADDEMSGFSDLVAAAPVTAADAFAATDTWSSSDKNEVIGGAESRQDVGSMDNDMSFFDLHTSPEEEPVQEASDEVQTFSLTPSAPEPVQAVEPEVAEEPMEEASVEDEPEMLVETVVEDVIEEPLVDDDDSDVVVEEVDPTDVGDAYVEADDEDDGPSEDELLAQAAAAIFESDIVAREEREAAEAPAPIEVENEADSDEVMTFALDPTPETDGERVEKIKNYVDEISGTNKDEDPEE